jgi:hypothetical protein
VGEGRRETRLYLLYMPTAPTPHFPLPPPLSLSPVLDPAGSASRLAFYQAVKKAGSVDAVELFDTVFKSKAFGVRLTVCVCVVPYSLVPCVSFLHVPPNSHPPSLRPSVPAKTSKSWTTWRCSIG